jgi:hypothetical protein
MDIQDPKTTAYVLLLGAVNFEHTPMGHLKIADQFSFMIDWTKGGSGQAILRDHLRLKTPLAVKHQGTKYLGVPLRETGMNSNDGIVVVEQTP